MLWGIIVFYIREKEIVEYIKRIREDNIIYGNFESSSLEEKILSYSNLKLN